jgi:hypothetical protein
MKRMSKITVRENAASSPAVVRARLNQLYGSRRRSIFGLPEIIGLAAAGLLLLAALVSYFYFLLPARSRLQQAGEDRTKLQNELRVATEGQKLNESTQASVEEIIGSLQDFEARNLVSRNEAGTAVIEELNTLIRRNALRITTGVSFTQFDVAATTNAPAGQGQQRAPVTTGAVRPIQDVFPGVGVSLTVEGRYENLRHFIRDVEADRRFIVINAVELEGITDTNATRAAVGVPGASPALPSARGATLVSLKLNMAAYFRRLSEAPAYSATESAR